MNALGRQDGEVYYPGYRNSANDNSGLDREAGHKPLVTVEAGQQLHDLRLTQKSRKCKSGVE